MVGLLSVAALCGCGGQPNQLAAFLEDAELQCETEAQRCNLCHAFQDMLDLTPEQLRERRYCDYTGQPGRWDLPTLLSRHFVPGAKQHSMGPRFYDEVKSADVQRQVKRFLDQLSVFDEGT
jgi:hypothetical protein